ncbi:peroxiredoxin [Myceligenerans xiligouense]|uniref:Alkyl hydroperoxide reductase E n=1 Tax=Myceligenerans xiligouense TaxID=253184 RepID=A0A3N4Z441_9MICO|nr:peroxiredoxin [Myceligenerans xiligouense]RPF20698.1 peroxiredoxin [Myceligenerans xiligouense]
MTALEPAAVAARTVGPGDPAPDFTLPDTHGTPVHLADLRGQATLVVFYPFAFSGLCTSELCELRDNIEDFETVGVRLLAVSSDPVFALKAWQEAEGFGFDLLSDFWPHGAVARAFGVFDEESGHALRGSFLVDADGIVRWSVLSPRGRQRDLEGYRQALAEI